MSTPEGNNSSILDENSEKICQVCKIENPTYNNFPCRCCYYCKKCAMKLATGGKCKICHELFTSMTLIKI